MSQWQPRQYDPQAHQRRMQPGAPPGYQEQPQPPRGYYPPQPWPAMEAPVPQPARSRPPYPAHLVRFPSQAFPRSRRRGRGPSLGRIFYLGRHPVALMIQACLILIASEVILAWIALVVMAWAFWTAAVTAGWLCQMAAAAMRRR